MRILTTLLLLCLLASSSWAQEAGGLQASGSKAAVASGPAQSIQPLVGTWVVSHVVYEDANLDDPDYQSQWHFAKDAQEKFVIGSDGVIQFPESLLKQKAKVRLEGSTIVLEYLNGLAGSSQTSTGVQGGSSGPSFTTYQFKIDGNTMTWYENWPTIKLAVTFKRS